MKNIFACFITLFFVCFLHAEEQTDILTKVKKMLSFPHTPDHILLGFKDGVSEIQKRRVFEKVLHSGQLGHVKPMASGKIHQEPAVYHITLLERERLETVLATLLMDNSVFYAEPNYIRKICSTPDDTHWSKQYDKRRIFCPAAWDTRTDAAEKVIAILDTGVDYAHVDLAENRWTNDGETNSNGVDDDGNGIVDDYYGARFTSGDGNPTSGDPNDGMSHGTHCAGIVAAHGNNNAGIAGVCWHTKVMAVKVLDDSGKGYDIDIAAGVDYAIKQDASIILLCLGGSGAYSSTLYNALKRARSGGVIVVCAAGNEESNNDTSAEYPANYDLDNIVTVASSDDQDMKSSFSNYGNSKVDLFAPGSDIYSTVLADGYDYKSGTSMAASQVAGAIALVWSEYPSLEYTQVIKHIYNRVDKLTQLEKYCATDGRLNVAAAVTPPCVVAGFGANQGGVKVYQYSSQLSPSREREHWEATEINSDRSLGWSQITNDTTKAVAICDLNKDGYPDISISKGSSVIIYSILEKKAIATVAPGGTIHKIVPVPWRSEDETASFYNDLVLVGSSGIFLWRQKPSVKLTKIFSGKILDAAYIKLSSGDFPTELIFSVENKGVYEYLTNGTTSKLWQVHAVDATLLASLKKSSGEISVVAAFPGYGIYTYDMKDDGTWDFVDAEMPIALTTANVDGSGDAEIVATLPVSGGVFARISGAWNKVTSYTARQLSSSNMDYDSKDEIVAAFQEQGVVRYHYTGPAWSFISLDSKQAESLWAWQK